MGTGSDDGQDAAVAWPAVSSDQAVAAVVEQGLSAVGAIYPHCGVGCKQGALPRQP
jgi:hypothetical protein